MSSPEDELRSRIDGMRQARVDQLRDGEFGRMVDAFYADDARLMPPNQPTVRGRDAIRRFWEETPDSGLIALELESTEIDGSGDLAFESGEFHRTIRPRHGHLFQDHGKYMVVYRRLDGEWKAVAEIFNSERGR